MKFEVTNWPEYEAGLRRRGSLTLWMTAEALSQWQAPKRPTRGGQPRYSDLAIETALTLGLVFGLRLRQAEGLLTRIRLDTMRTNQPAAPVKGKGLVSFGPLSWPRSTSVPGRMMATCGIRLSKAFAR
jgi:hypothetical protein